MHAYQPERLVAVTQNQNPVLQLINENKVLCSGAFVSLIVMVMIFSNAVFFQTGPHPSPLFSTRNINTVKPLDEQVEVAKLTKPKSVATSDVQLASAPAAGTITNDNELLREVQSALSVRGYYDGKLDGVYGSRTKRAIEAFQQDQSLAVNGLPSVRLLTHVLMSGSSTPAAVPVPNKTQLVQQPVSVKTVKVSGDGQLTTASTQTPTEEPTADALVARIQAGLRNYGYDDLQVDGKMGQQTATAIQRFQLDYGMKITGEASNSVLKKLSEIGAYTQG